MKFRLKNSTEGTAVLLKFWVMGGVRMMRCVPPFEQTSRPKSVRNKEPSNSSELSGEDLLAL